jgi:hypothetical protein
MLINPQEAIQLRQHSHPHQEKDDVKQKTSNREFSSHIDMTEDVTADGSDLQAFYKYDPEHLKLPEHVL